jgi:selenocysteine lyase/cysteine desulfurase
MAIVTLITVRLPHSDSLQRYELRLLGSFGTYPRFVRARLRELQDEAEAEPDIYIRASHVKYMNESRHLLAKYLNAPASTIVLVPNATTGLNTVLRNIVYKERDTIICFSTTYGSMVKTLLSLAETTPVSVTSIPLLNSVALSTSSILAAVEKTVLAHRASGLNPRALFLDAIVSEPGMRMPFESLVSLCRRLNILSIVDGAHAIGMIPLDLTELDADFFVTNCHKWLYVPRACAVLHVPQRNQHMIRTTLPTSAGFVPRLPPGKVVPPPLEAQSIGANTTGGEKEDEDTTPFIKLFEYVGTMNNQAFNCVAAALQFRDSICGGEEKVMKYCSSIAAQGAKRVAAILGTETLDNEERSLSTGLAMVNVRMPLDPERLRKLDRATQNAPVRATQDADVNPAWAEHVRVWIGSRFIEEYNTSVPIVWWGGAFWTRLSGQIYLDLADFEAIGRQMNGLCRRVMDGEHLRGL